MQRAAEVIETDLRNELEPILKGMGLVLVEIIVSLMKNSSSVMIVIYKTGGVSVADTTAVAKIIKPRLELHDDLNDFRLEVASPGISRRLKTRAEYKIFTGRGLAVLKTADSEWTNGILEQADDEQIILNTGDVKETISFAQIKRAKLITLEGENYNVL